MGKLAVRLAALEKKRPPVERRWWEERSPEDTMRAVEEALRRAEEREAEAARLPVTGRLALRRAKLEDLDRRPIDGPRQLRSTLQMAERECRRILLEEIERFELEFARSVQAAAVG